MSTAEWDRISALEGLPIESLIARLELGEAVDDIMRSTGWEPRNLVVAVALDVLGSSVAGPKLVQEKPRRPRLVSAISVTGLPSLFLGADRPQQLALSTGLLQIHDFWEESHHAAQEADELGEMNVSAYWHGVAHRREPDLGNASYWFRRVARHPIFTPLAEAARVILETNSVDHRLIAKLLPRGMWDPVAFIEICSRERTLETIARQIQREELRLLLLASIPD